MKTIHCYIYISLGGLICLTVGYFFGNSSSSRSESQRLRLAVAAITPQIVQLVNVSHKENGFPTVSGAEQKSGVIWELGQRGWRYVPISTERCHLWWTGLDWQGTAGGKLSFELHAGAVEIRLFYNKSIMGSGTDKEIDWTRQE